MSETSSSRRDELLETSRTRIARAVRSGLGFDGRLTKQTWTDACEQAGVHPEAFRTLFPTDDELLDRINAMIVEDTAARLRGGVGAFALDPASDRDPFEQAATCLALAMPMDTAGLVIRAERRLSALRSGDSAAAVVAAERSFVAALTDSITEVLARIDRRFAWRPELAVRVVLDTYERSFEAWVLLGHDETDFATSPFVERTFPELLRGMSA